MGEPRSGMHHLAAVAAALFLLVSINLGWFVDRDMQTFGPTGAVDCRDLPCDLAYIDIPSDLEVLQFLTWLGAVCSAGATIVSLCRRARTAAAAITVAATAVIGIAYWLDATLLHDLATSIRAPEAGSLSPHGLSLFLASAAVLLWALRCLRSPPCLPVAKQRR